MAVVIILNSLFPISSSINVFDIVGGAFGVLTNFSKDVENNILGFFNLPQNISYNDEIYCMRVRFQNNANIGYGVFYADFITKDINSVWQLSYSNYDGVYFVTNRVFGRTEYQLLVDVDGKTMMLSRFFVDTGALDFEVRMFRHSLHFESNPEAESFADLKKLTYREYLSKVRKNSVLSYYVYFHDVNIYD